MTVNHELKDLLCVIVCSLYVYAITSRISSNKDVLQREYAVVRGNYLNLQTMYQKVSVIYDYFVFQFK